MTDVTRRDVLKFLAAAPLAEFAVTAFDLDRAATITRETLEGLANRGQQYRPKHFSPDDWRTVRVLVDIVIPRDARSGSATDAAVPEFMDFMLGDRPNMRPWMREGLSWLTAECEQRFGKAFADCTPEQRIQVVEDIAWPRKAKPEMQTGVRFFNNFRNLTSSGFWSSQIGVKDLGYIGNMPQAHWNGCPPPALAKLGVRYT